MEIKKSELDSNQIFSAIISEYNKDRLKIELHNRNSDNIYLESVRFNQSKISFVRALNKWNRICMSFDFLRHEAQVAFNGHLSEKVSNVHAIALEDPIDINNQTFKPKFVSISVGRYYFDKTPLIGRIVNINVWNRTMLSEELIQRTQCNETFVDDGSVINRFSNWTLSGSLPKNISMNVNETSCIESKNGFLPISALSRAQAESQCKKIGQHTSIAGNFENRKDFDIYYDDLLKTKDLSVRVALLTMAD